LLNVAQQEFHAHADFEKLEGTLITAQTQEMTSDKSIGT